MTGLVAQAALILALGQGGEEGFATRYDLGVMHTAAANHGLPIATCMVAWDGAPLGSFVWVRSEGTGRLLYCQVSDESAGSADVPGSDKWRHMRVNLVEFDFWSARVMCVDFNGPWRHCPVTIWR